MLFRLVQRTGLRLSTLGVPSYTRAVLPSLSIAMRPSTQTRLFMVTSRLALARAKTVTKISKTAEEGDKKPAAKTKKAAVKKTAKKTVKKTEKKPAKKARTVPKRVKKVRITLRTMKISKEDQPPKAPPNSYLLFYTDFLAKGGKPANSTDVIESSKKCGALWKALSDAERQKYADTAHALMEDYRKRMVEYMQNTDPTTVKAIALQRKAKGLSKTRVPKAVKLAIPRRPVNGYVRFTNEYRSSVQPPTDLVGLQIGRFVTSAAAKQWATMTEVQKEPYREAFRAELEDWNAKYKKAAAST